jgi:hypothetical protein
VSRGLGDVYKRQPQHRPPLLLLLLHLPRLRGLAVGANALRRLVVCRTLRPVSGLRT